MFLPLPRSKEWRRSLEQGQLLISTSNIIQVWWCSERGRRLDVLKSTPIVITHVHSSFEPFQSLSLPPFLSENGRGL
jgi:hypothetical protein